MSNQELSQRIVAVSSDGTQLVQKSTEVRFKKSLHILPGDDNPETIQKAVEEYLKHYWVRDDGYIEELQDRVDCLQKFVSKLCEIMVYRGVISIEDIQKLVEGYYELIPPDEVPL